MRQSQSDTDYGYRTMTTQPRGLTQSSVSTKDYFYCNDAESHLSLPLTYCSSSESCVSCTHPERKPSSLKQAQRNAMVEDLPELLHSMHMSPNDLRHHMHSEERQVPGAI